MSNNEPKLTQTVGEILEQHPPPWTHHALLIKDANGRQVLHTGGLYSERGRLHEGAYLSGLNALFVELVNRSHASIAAVEGDARFIAYNQAIEDAKTTIRGERVDDPYAAATFINAIARKCSPHVYVARLTAASSPSPASPVQPTPEQPTVSDAIDAVERLYDEWWDIDRRRWLNVVLERLRALEPKHLAATTSPSDTAVGGEAEKRNEDGELTSPCKHCGQSISQTVSTGSWYHDAGWSHMCTKLVAAPVSAVGDDEGDR